MGIVNVDEAAQRLYALPPERFTAARDDLARQADPGVRKAVKALRKPSLPAYVVNRLVRERPEQVDNLLALGDELREAMSGGGDLRRLTEQRRHAVAELVSVASKTAGRKLPGTVEEDVAATLEAATADPRLAEAVRSGRLVKPLRYAGFGVFPDLGDVVATAVGPSAPPGTAGPASAPTPPTAANKSATRAVKQAPQTRASTPPAEPPGATRDVELASLRAHALALAGAADDARRRYDAAVRALRQARKALQDAEQERASARKEATAAQKEAEKARREVGRLERSLVRRPGDLVDELRR